MEIVLFDIVLLINLSELVLTLDMSHIRINKALMPFVRQETTDYC